MSNKRRKGCSACKGLGFILADNDVHGIRIERCDECCRFNSDALAVEYVYEKAREACSKPSVLRSDILAQLKDMNATPSVLRDMSSYVVHLVQVISTAADEIEQLRKLTTKKKDEIKYTQHNKYNKYTYNKYTHKDVPIT